MKRKAITKENCAQVKGKKQVSRQHIREAPRQKIRHLLRSFIPLDELMPPIKSDPDLISQSFINQQPKFRQLRV